jgi:hypothetical protein
MAQGDVVFKERGVFPIYHSDVTQVFNSLTRTVPPPFPEATLGFFYDVYGYRQANYRQNYQGSTLNLGGLYSRAVSGTLTVDTGSATTSFTDSAAALGTTGKFIGAVVVVLDDAGAAGAAPEGETTVIGSHTDTVATFDINLPLSTALAAGDTVSCVSPKIVNSATNDAQSIVAGCALSAITSFDWGWVQNLGVHPRTRHSAAAVATQTALIAGTAVVATFGTATAVVGGTAPAGSFYQVGSQIIAHSADNVTTESPVLFTLVAGLN